MGLLVSSYFEFLLNVQKYLVLHRYDISNLPKDILDKYNNCDPNIIRNLIQKLFSLINGSKVDMKTMLEAWVIERCI